MVWVFLSCLNNKRVTYDRNLHYIYKEFGLFAMIVYDRRIIFSLKCELKFFLVSRRERCKDHSLWNLANWYSFLISTRKTSTAPSSDARVRTYRENRRGEEGRQKNAVLLRLRGRGEGVWLPTRWFDPAQRGTSRWDFRPRYSRGNKITPALRPYIHNCRQPPTLRKRLRLESRN